MAAKRIVLPGYLSRAGAAAPSGGYVSLLAFWLGGAASGIVVPPQPGPGGGGGGGGPSIRPRQAADWIRRISRDDEEIIMLIPELWTVIHHEE